MNSKKSKLNQPFVFLVLAIFLTGIIGYFVPWSERERPAPDITFVLTDGKKLSLSSLHGRPVLISFWATTCKICIAKTPEMNALYQQLAPKGFEMVAVAMPYDPPTHVLTVSNNLGMPYPVALDLKAEAVRAFGDVKVTPTTFLISPAGNIVWHNKGKFSSQRLKKRIVKLIRDYKRL